MKRILATLMIMVLMIGMVSAAAESGKTLFPLPNTTMESLDNATVAVSLDKGDAYLADDGKMRMTLGIYGYDMYDMVDVSMLAAGDTLLLCGEDVFVESVEARDDGTVLINGGMDEDGVTLITYEDGVYHALDYNDGYYWYLLGYADFIVSPDFVFTDYSDLEKEEPTVLYPGDFLIENPDIDYYFYPNSTTVRIENDIIVSMERIYTP